MLCANYTGSRGTLRRISRRRAAADRGNKKGKTMAISKKENACASEAVDAFGGIDRAGLIGRLSEAWDIDNFRILADGSLDKREGYELRHTFCEPVDAVCPLPGEAGQLYVLAGGCVYLMTLDDGEARLLGRASDAPGGCFFTLGGSLYLLAGGNLCAVTTTCLLPLEGYIPLYGHDWSEEGGEVSEPRNLLSRRIRLSYRLRTPSVVLKTGLSDFSIESLSIDGSPLGTAYAQGQFICLPGSFPEGTLIETVLVFDADCEATEALLACRRALTTGHGERETAVLCGHDTLFFSAPVGASELAASKACSPASMGIYFPEGKSVRPCPGTGNDAESLSAASTTSRALCAVGNENTLLVSDGERSCLLSRGGELTALPDTPGADCPGICIGDNVYMVSRRGLFRVSLKDGSTQCLSLPLDDPDLPGESPVMGFDPRYSELLISSADDTCGRVWVRSLSRECWYRFSSVGAQGWFNTDDALGFFAENGVFVFVPERGSDIVLGGAELEIEASFISRWSSMGQDGCTKRLRALRLCGQGDEALSLLLSAPAGALTEVSIPAGNGRSLDLHRRRLRTGRFEHVQLSISSCGTGRTRIFGVAVYAIK